MVGKAREPERDTTVHSRADKSPTRSTPSDYRDRSRDRSNGRVNGGVNSGAVPTSDKKKVLKNHNDVEAEESLKEKETEERGRGRASRKDDEAVQESVQSIADMKNGEMMMKMMGFGSFDSTKGKHVAGAAGAVSKKNKSTKYRQYMNREKGFNRALSPGRKR